MERALSLDAKLIAATNMAIAEAIWQKYYLERGGAPAQPADQMVLRDIKQSVKELEKDRQEDFGRRVECGIRCPHAT
jgi:hypothetical protein